MSYEYYNNYTKIRLFCDKIIKSIVGIRKQLIIISKINVNPFILTLGGFFIQRLAYLLEILSTAEVGKISISSNSVFSEIING